LKAIVAQHLIVADGSANRPSENGNPVSPTRRSRVVTSEVLIANPAVANLIATGKSNQIYSSMETGGLTGMQTLEEDLARLWASNQISESTAMAMARSPQVVRDRAASLRTNGSGAYLRKAVR
jgi:twitching motility protein PilT